MAFFETIEAASAFVWALPLGIGKIISIGGGGFFVGIVGKHFLSDIKSNNNENNQTVSNKIA